MQAVMEKEDGQSVINVLRWSGMGVMPGSVQANYALDLVKAAKNSVQGGEILNLAEQALNEVRRGVSVSQEICKQAVDQVKQLMRGDDDGQAHVYVERDLG